MFKPGNLYRHRSFIDVDMYVLGAEKVHNDYRLTVRYFNRFYLIFQGGVDHVTIQEKDVKNWIALSNK